MSTTNIPVFIGRRSVSSVCAKTHMQTVSMEMSGCSVDKNNNGVDARVAFVNLSSVYKMSTREYVTKYVTDNFDIYDAFNDKFTIKNITEEKTTNVPSGTTINTVNKDSSKQGEVLKRKKICVELKTRNKENSLKSSLSEISTNVTKSNSMLTMRKSNLIQIVLDENKNEIFQEDNGKKLKEQTETHTKSIKNSDFKQMKRKKKLKQTNKPPLTTKKGKSSGEKGSKCLDVSKNVTKRTKLNKDDVNISESGKTISCILGSVKRKLKRKRGNSTSSNSTDSAISHFLNSSHSRYGSRRSHSWDRCRRSHSRDRDRRSDSRHQDPRSHCKDRESSSYSPDPYIQRGRYLHNRHSTDSQSSDSCKLSDSLLPCSDDQSLNRSEYLDEIDSYAREQLEHSKYNNSRCPPHMYPIYGDIHNSSYSGHRSKCSRNRSRSSDGTISENYSSCDSYCCDSQTCCSHRRLVISRSGGKRFVTFRSDRKHSKYKSGYKRKRSPRSGSKGFPSLGSRSRVNRSISPWSRVRPRRSSRFRSRGKSSSRSVSHRKDPVSSCSPRMESQTSTYLAERSPRSRYRRKRSSKSRTHTSSSKSTSHGTKIPRSISSRDKMKSRTSRSSQKVKKNDTFIGEKIGKLEDKFNENRKNIQRDIQQFNQKATYLNTTETNSDTRNMSDHNIKIKPGDLDSIVIISDGEPEAEVVIFKNGVEKNSRIIGKQMKELNFDTNDIQKNMSDFIFKTENKEKTDIGVFMLSQNVNSPIIRTSRGLLSSNDKKVKQQKCGKNTDTTKQKVRINLTNRLPRIMNMRKTIRINAKGLQKFKKKKSPNISKEIKSTNFTSDRLELSTLVIEIGQDLHKIWNEYFEN